MSVLIMGKQLKKRELPQNLITIGDLIEALQSNYEPSDSIHSLTLVAISSEDLKENTEHGFVSIVANPIGLLQSKMQRANE